MKKPTNENMIPKWIADIFKTKKEKRSEQEQLDLDRYVADLRMNNPEKYEKLQSILKHIDPDTGHLPTGLNTAGSLDENIYDDIKATNPPFKEWTYDRTGKNYLAKGRNKEEAAIYVKLRYPEVGDIDLEKMEGGKNNISVTDKYVMSIYTKEPMSEMKDKLRKIVKELVADMPPTEKVSTMPGQDIKDQMISAVSATNDPNILKQLSIVFGGAGFKDSDNLGEMKRKLVPLMSKAGASQYLKLAQKFAVENGEIVLKSGKQDVAFMKETLMKKIREAFDMSMRTVNPKFVYHVQVKKNGDIVTTYNGVGGDKANQLVNAKQRGLVSADSIRNILGSNSEVEDGTYTVLVSTDSQNNRGTIKLDKADSPFIQDKGTKVNENKMKVTQLKQIIREEIQKMMKENDLDNLDLSPREKREFPGRKANLIKRNPQFAKLSDQEILDMIRDHDREYELMTREMPDEF